MELWIRSQDKSTLSKITEISFDNDFIMGKNDNQVYAYLGQYNSKERCLEILDEVQKILIADPAPLLVFTNCDVTEDTYNGLNEMYKKGDLLALSVYSPQENVKIIEKSTVIYEMPEE